MAKELQEIKTLFDGLAKDIESYQASRSYCRCCDESIPPVNDFSKQFCSTRCETDFKGI